MIRGLKLSRPIFSRSGRELRSTTASTDIARPRAADPAFAEVMSAL
jgi:hypothetical protein